METQLGINLRADRALGIPIMLWMVKCVAEDILYDLHPDLFHEDPEVEGKRVCDFKFSDGWISKWMVRGGFSLRNYTNRSKVLLNKEIVHEHIQEYHVRMRVLQRSERNDPDYGFASPTNIFCHDQMPIMLAAPGTKTIDNKGADVVWVSIGKDSDEKRTATLDLYVPMEVMFDKSGKPLNLPPPHIIFSATSVQSAQVFDPEEEKEYHRGVVVTFAPNAWVNEEVHILGLKMCLAPQIERITKAKQKGIECEDNLSSHKTSAVQELWSTYFKDFAHEFGPENLTMDTQALDHHVLIRYHKNIYKAFREMMVLRIREKKPLDMSAKDKRIFLTHVIGNTNDEMAEKQAFFQSFVSTGTIVKLDGSQDNEVRMQNTKSYDYKLHCSPEIVSAAEKKIEDEKRLLIQKKIVIAQAEAAELLALQPFLDAERLLFEPAVHEGEGLWAANLLVRMELVSMPLVNMVADCVKSSFIWYGSSVVALINREINRMKCENALAQAHPLDKPLIELSFGDYDFILPEEGTISISQAGPLKLVFVIGDNIKVVLPASPALPVKPVNFVRCRSPTLLAVLGDGNVDINACAAGAVINVVDGKVASFEWLIQPSCWHFLLHEPMMFRPISNRTGAQTLIRLAYKSFQLKLPFSKEFRGKELDEVTGENIIYRSHKEKYDTITLAKWSENPFPPTEYSLVAKSKNSWVFEDKFATCPTCYERGCKACKNGRRCKTCCTVLQQSTMPPSATCSTHKLTAQAAAAEPKPPAPITDEEDSSDIDTGIDIEALRAASEKATKDAAEKREAFEKASQAHKATVQLRKKQRLGAAAPVAAAAAPLVAAAPVATAAPVAAVALHEDG
jgi:hypothetical protein